MAREGQSREVLELTALRQGLRDRIEAFLKKYNLKPAAFGLVVRTTEQNVRGWLKGKTLPPGPVAPLMDALEQSDEVRQLLGVYRLQSKKPQQRAVKPRPVRDRLVSRDLAERNKSSRKDDPYFDVELFLEGPVNWPTLKAQTSEAGPQECDD